jgi:hypothetical protein
LFHYLVVAIRFQTSCGINFVIQFVADLSFRNCASHIINKNVDGHVSFRTAGAAAPAYHFIYVTLCLHIMLSLALGSTIGRLCVISDLDVAFHFGLEYHCCPW